MTIHRDYARLNAADRALVDLALDGVMTTIRESNRTASNIDPAERLAEAIASYLIDSGGAARIGDGETLTAGKGEIHPSYNRF